MRDFMHVCIDVFVHMNEKTKLKKYKMIPEYEKMVLNEKTDKMTC